MIRHFHVLYRWLMRRSAQAFASDLTQSINVIAYQSARGDGSGGRLSHNPPQPRTARRSTKEGFWTRNPGSGGALSHLLGTLRLDRRQHTVGIAPCPASVHASRQPVARAQTVNPRLGNFTIGASRCIEMRPWRPCLSFCLERLTGVVYMSCKVVPSSCWEQKWLERVARQSE